MFTDVTGDVHFLLLLQGKNKIKQVSNEEYAEFGTPLLQADAQLAYSSNLNMKTVCSSEMSASFHHTTLHYIPENATQFTHRCQKHKLIIKPVNAAVPYFRAVFIVYEISFKRNPVYRNEIPPALKTAISCKSSNASICK
jgi:hypothetical protein